MKKEHDTHRLEPGTGVYHILNRAYRQLGNPIALIDTSYNLLASTQNPVTDDALWNELLEKGMFPHETVDFFNRAHFIQAVAESDVVALLRESSVPYDRACGKIFDGSGIQLGSIAVVACRKPFAQGDFALIETFCAQLGREMQENPSYHIRERVFHDAFISELLDPHPNKARLCGQVEALCRNLKSNLYVAVADISQYEHTLSHLAYLRDLFASLQNDFKYFIYLNNIVMLFSTDAPLLRVHTDLQALDAFFLRYHIFAGLSDSFQDVFALRGAYRQAMAALNHGMCRAGPRRIFKYDDFRLDCFLDSIKDTTEVQGLCNPIVALLDSEESLLLQTYLLHAKNTRRTCEQLGISRETLRRRLRRLQETYEIDWDDGNLLLSLAISFKALACMGEQ